MTETPRDPLRREGRMLVILGGVLLVLSLAVAATLPFNDQDVLNPSRGPVIAIVGIPTGAVILIVGIVRLVRTRRKRQ